MDANFSALVLMMTIRASFFFTAAWLEEKCPRYHHAEFHYCRLISIQWVLWGYSLAFGPDVGGIIGSLAWFGLNGVGTEPNADYAADSSSDFHDLSDDVRSHHSALITGAFAGGEVWCLLGFILLWATFIYDPLAHWVWGVKGWMREMGALDFAGAL
jgi:Amt family ammonium transporter